MENMDATIKTMYEKMMTRMEAINEKMNARIKVMDKKMDAKMEKMDENMGARMKKMDAKRTNTLGNVFADENTAASEVKIRSFTRGSGSTIPGKIYENPAAITIDTGAEELIVRKRLMRVEDGYTITSDASVEICIGQLRIRHRALVASMEDDFILGMDLISRHGLTIDPMKEVLRLGNEEFKLNQRCIEGKPARLIAY
ncbi:hypothetical protein Zmor_014530 [Zophobas morio]|uniref:Uncharacterized protein n=1 Tax=Zophobas morio TaxID=2755281 RepID=A0AA38IHS1_9CUCU|nr:hypothetical protein Zmor_014530 [Zophobas morio]